MIFDYSITFTKFINSNIPLWACVQDLEFTMFYDHCNGEPFWINHFVNAKFDEVPSSPTYKMSKSIWIGSQIATLVCHVEYAILKFYDCFVISNRNNTHLSICLWMPKQISMGFCMNIMRKLQFSFSVQPIYRYFVGKSSCQLLSLGIKTFYK